jgi:hypothetical protein
MKSTEDSRRYDSAETLDHAMERSIFLQRTMNS